jgi:hypothetical protein
LHNFLDYNDFLYQADDLLHDLKLDGVLQIASFHPDYQFADENKEDMSHCTNRSPYPMLHLLREDSLDQAISAKPEPKTDLVLKIGTKVYSVSVKMAGGVQLASGQGSSTAELFEAAAKQVPGASKSKVLLSIIKELKTMPTRLLSESNKKRILDEASEKVINEFIKGGKIIKDKSYEYWMTQNKELLMESLLKYINSDKDYATALLYEAMTGELSLAQYKGAVADSIISPKGFYIIDKKYVESVKSKVKFDVRGKSRSGITGLAFRIDLRP